ncbi:hypothetical protein KSP39_PZI007688 [Platanthera zijinensis]|uniref:Uncharacterized protein n=1 Tax=Platanthera zijinensis TaxID=2320716 RepID=A0AAP0G8T7_9ASPA
MPAGKRPVSSCSSRPAVVEGKAIRWCPKRSASGSSPPGCQTEPQRAPAAVAIGRLEHLLRTFLAPSWRATGQVLSRRCHEHRFTVQASGFLSLSAGPCRNGLPPGSQTQSC